MKINNFSKGKKNIGANSGSSGKGKK